MTPDPIVSQVDPPSGARDSWEGRIGPGSDLGGVTCQGLGFDFGALACDGGCGFDTSGCSYGSCELAGAPCDASTNCCSGVGNCSGGKPSSRTCL